MMLKFRLLLLVCVFEASTLAHLCMWQPMQRGNFTLDPPGSDDCYRKVAPCGGFNSSTSKQRTILQVGTMYTVHFQQHINHYYPPNPGRLDISFAVGLDPDDEDFHILHSFNDYNPMNHNAETNFSISIQLPMEPCSYCVLRVRYITNNPDEEDQGRTFHQCSDIRLVPSATAKNTSFSSSSVTQTSVPMNNPYDCCTPRSFQTSFLHRIPEINYTSSGIIYYDQPSQQMRISMFVTDVHYNMWMNFTSGVQYYEDVEKNDCHLFGLDLWNDWCYGNTYNQSEDFLAANVSCSKGNNQLCNQWQNGEFLFESTMDRCFPVALSRQTSRERTDYFDSKDGPFPPKIFQPDPRCLTKAINHRHHLRSLFPLSVLARHKL